MFSDRGSRWASSTRRCRQGTHARSKAALTFDMSIAKAPHEIALSSAGFVVSEGRFRGEPR